MIARIAVLSLIALTLTGCWDRAEVEDLAIVQGIALDRADDGMIELTTAIVVPERVTPPGAFSTRDPLPAVLTNKAAKGRTVMDAVGALQLNVPRRLFFAHNAVVLIGETLAREGVTSVIDFFSRQRQPRLRTVVAVVDGRAKDVLSTFSPIEGSSPTAIREVESLRNEVSVTMQVFLEMLASDSMEPITARIGILHGGALEPGFLGDPQDGGGSSGSADPLSPAVTGSAIFRGDRLVGYLDPPLSRTVLGMRNELKLGVFAIPIGEGAVSFQVRRFHTTLKPMVASDRPVMQVSIRITAELQDNTAKLDTSEPEVIELLETALARTVTGLAHDAVERLQALGCDVIDFGDAFRRFRPQWWRTVRHRWAEVFSGVHVELDVEATILRTGLSSKPLGVEKSELIKADELARMLEVHER